MPQINQLSQIFASQLFWLAIVFGIVYFVIGRGLVPKIQGVVDQRERTIAENLTQAQAAREAADATESMYREQMDASRSEAFKLAQDAKQAGAREVEKRIAEASEKIDSKIRKAEAKIGKSTEAALSEIENVAVEATRDIFAKLTGETVTDAAATRAVKAAING